MRDIANAYPNAVPAKVQNVTERQICLSIGGNTRWYDHDALTPMGIAIGNGAEGMRFSVPNDDGTRTEVIVWFELTPAQQAAIRWDGSRKTMH